MPRPLPIAVLVSGAGTTLDALSESIQGGHVPARIVLVVADRAGTGAIDLARSRGLPTLELLRSGTPDSKWEFELDGQLREFGAELVLLAGFLSILPSTFVHHWAGRIVNVHPSLLPRHGGPGLYGPKVHESVLASGDAETGATVHLVDEGVDTGRILEQSRVPVEVGDTPATLREKVRPLEIAAISDVLRKIADGVWTLPLEPGAPSGGAPGPDRGTRLGASKT
ncbi:MAG: phosphoribosylglycinamide formyltransferase [Thermoplasmata archaeon]|nr:phosphoribosylglycinamide formyltransferase [Thermoplasmata archaeon]